MAEAFVEVLLQNLCSFMRRELGMIYGMDEELNKLSSLLSTIKAVIQDTENEKLKENATRNWLQKLNIAAYEVDDVLDECATKAIKLQGGNRKLGCISMPSGASLKHILFRRQMGQKIRDSIRKLDAIAEERIKFHPSEVAAKKQTTTGIARETGFVLTQSEVYGRDDDKKKIVEILMKHVDDFGELLVLPIVGMGGLGKTTLAQLIFNDVTVSECFDLKIWVSVSHNFDEKRLIRAILEAGGGNVTNASELASLQSRLLSLLGGKRYLLVLDDVWNEDQERWDKLKALLTFESRGTSVITTTRLEKVASIMGTVPPHRLSCLSEDDCWLLFKQRAFGLDREQSPDLVVVGKEIVKRCCGVPLAAKALGSVLRFKSDEKEWLFVRDSDFWNLPQDESSILPALRLSYFHLPQDLRHCFAYCAIFEKGSKIDKEELIYIWMANGFISSEGNLELEDRGNDVWNELCWRSLFQEAQENSDGRILFKIHDLIHDLAQSITDDTGHAPKLGGETIMPNRIRHATIHAEDKAFLAFPKSIMPYSPSMVATFGSLRVLIFCSVQLKELPSSIGDLIHLRYLDLYSTRIESLPQTICSLQNLQVLKVEDCCLLRVLPRHLRYLGNLRHLRLQGCPLSHMPCNIGELTHLKTLDKFVVGKKRCSKLGDLRDLNIGGKLVIEHLERVENYMEAKESLSSKENLISLVLYWNHSTRYESSKDVDQQVLEVLEPHSNLEHLKISGFRGKLFASWMGASILINIITFCLHDCKFCLHLPPLARLPCLKSLSLRGIPVEYIDSDLESGSSHLRKFPCLESLELCKLPNLKRFSVKEGEDERFPSLHEIWIEDCPLLIFPRLLSLKKLRNMKCSNMTLASISNLCSLTSLAICNNTQLSSFPENVLKNLTNLNTLWIVGFLKLEELPKSLASLTALKFLRLDYCQQLESLPEHGLQGLTSLRKLSINHSYGLKSLSKGLKHLASLEEVEVFGCPELVSFPYEIRHLTALRRVHLDGLPMFITSDDAFIHPGELVMWQLPEALRHVPELKSLSVCRFPSLTLLPGWLGELTSLEELIIAQCDNIASLPECMERMNLQSLNISDCDILEKRCKPGEGEDWYKIAHIPKVKITQHCDFLGFKLSSDSFLGPGDFIYRRHHC